MDEIRDEVETLISKFPELEIVSGTKKVRCKLSGHEMPYAAKAIESYTGGKKFLKLKKDADFPYDKYQPFIIPSEEKKNTMFCCLTRKYINKLPHHIEKHTKGRKYQSAKMMYDSGKMELMKESDREKPGEDKQDMDFEEISEEKKEVSKEEDLTEDEKEEYEAEAMVNRKPFPFKDRKRKLNTEVKDSMSKRVKLLRKRKLTLTKGRKTRPVLVSK